MKVTTTVCDLCGTPLPDEALPYTLLYGPDKAVADLCDEHGADIRRLIEHVIGKRGPARPATSKRRASTKVQPMTIEEIEALKKR